MKVFGLTGGIGMGKSTAAELLRARGLVVDTDEVARQLVAPGQPALAEIRREFGAEILLPDGALSRAALAARVFSNPAERQRLEAILHPRIRTEWQEQVARWHRSGAPWAVVVIPLLFETQAEALCGSTICVACRRWTQEQRLQERGWTAAQSAQRIQAQWPIEQKMARADFVVWTEGPLAVLAGQLERIIPSK